MPLRQAITTSLIVAFLAAAAPAQWAAPGGDVRSGVFVRDSAVAVEKLALAERMERLKEWDKAADVYQEIIEKYADRVVQAGGGDNNNAGRYISVTLEVQRRLGKWPAEGLSVYRARYEAPAAALLESAGADDVAALNKVVQLYFATDAAKTA